MRLVFLCILLQASISCFACNCNPEIEEMNMARYNEAAAIFIGKVDSMSDCSTNQTVYFSVSKVYKGNLSTNTSIKEIDCKTACALTFEKGREYLVYAYNKYGSDLNLLPCTPNRKLLTQGEIDTEIKISEKYNTTAYIQKELKLWQQEISFLENIAQIKNGKVSITYPNGSITAKGVLENGIPVGEWQYFYPDGGLKAMGEYKNGMKNGFWIEYNLFYSSYEDTSVHAIRKKYIIKSNGHYQDGLKEGAWERINLDGSSLKLFYNKGKFVKEI